jgi:lactoylglutathione lyase
LPHCGVILAPPAKLPNFPPQWVAQFNHIALYVSDLKQSAAFYRDMIGAEIIPDPFRDDRHVWLKIGDHNQLHLIAGSQRAIPGNMHFAFSVPSVDAFVAHLTKSGIAYDDGHGGPNNVRLRADGVKQIYFQDPDGYWIEVNEDRF